MCILLALPLSAAHLLRHRQQALGRWLHTFGMVNPPSSKVVRALFGTVLMMAAKRRHSLIVTSAYRISARYSAVMLLPYFSCSCTRPSHSQYYAGVIWSGEDQQNSSGYSIWSADISLYLPVPQNRLCDCLATCYCYHDCCCNIYALLLRFCWLLSSLSLCLAGCLNWFRSWLLHDPTRSNVAEWPTSDIGLQSCVNCPWQLWHAVGNQRYNFKMTEDENHSHHDMHIVHSSFTVCLSQSESQ